MEQNTSTMAKKIWNLMRVAFFMLRKGICKRKILMDLNLVMKRGKIAGKGLQNLIAQHHHRHQDADLQVSTVGQSSPPGEYEFSCGDTPLYRHYFTSNKKKHEQNESYKMASSFEEMNNIFDMIMLSNNNNHNNTNAMTTSSSPSPALAGSRQLRITDSPFPVQNTEDCNHVDEAAEDFINKFYSQLKNQNN